MTPFWRKKSPKKLFDENVKNVCVKCGAELITQTEECPKCGYLHQSIADDPNVQVDQYGEPFIAVPEPKKPFKLDKDEVKITIPEPKQPPKLGAIGGLIILIFIVLLVAFFLYIPIEYAIIIILLFVCMLIWNIRGGGV